MVRAATTRTDAPVIVTQRLTKVFRDFWMRARVRAVDDLDLEIQRGEIFGLLGPNGSGKSTTIKMILGLLHKTSGRVAVFGKPPTDVGTKRRIGVLPEESYLYPFLNARETLDYYGKLFGIDPKNRRKRSDELLEMVGLTAVAHRQVKEYSKGMQRRIGLAQALINDPELLILDEPTSGLDPIGARQVKDLIVDLGRRGKTILLSSHQLSDVEDTVHRLAILYGGKKRAEGTCDELLTAHTRMMLEVDSIDDETIRQMDEVLRKRTGQHIRHVARPRQKLEDLFIDIVERARAERIETAGAAAGGGTAAFLLATEAEQAASLEGGDLIASLTTGEAPEAPAATQTAPAAPASTEPETTDDEADESVIGDLLAGEDATPEPEPERAPSTPKERGRDVDLGVIGSLLDGRSDEDDEEPKA
jgi:ABC-2 type transport system ATP-binding protein